MAILLLGSSQSGRASPADPVSAEASGDELTSLSNFTQIRFEFAMLFTYVWLISTEAKDSRYVQFLKKNLYPAESLEEQKSIDLHWTQLMIEKGLPDGKSVQKAFALIIKWNRLVEEVEGSALAQVNLGWHYAEGNGVAQDFAEAARWYKLAADQGDPYAQVSLGLLYAEGNGVAQDDAQAFKWFKLAAEQDDAEAQFNLGLLHAQGRGIPQDDVQAFLLFRLAAEKGYPAAQLNLGRMYRDGRGVSKDLVNAYMWLLIAAEDHAEVQTSIDDLEKQMKPAEIEKARSLASRYREGRL